MHGKLLCLGLEVAPISDITPLTLFSYMIMKLGKLGNNSMSIKEGRTHFSAKLAVSYFCERKKNVQPYT